MNQALTPEDRSQIARIAALTMHSKNDSKETSQPARDALARKFLDQVDPDKVLPQEERVRRAALAKKAHYQRMAYLSARARRAKKAIVEEWGEDA